MKRNVVVSKGICGAHDLHDVMDKTVEMESIESYISDNIKKANAEGWKAQTASIMFVRDRGDTHEVTFITVNQW